MKIKLDTISQKPFVKFMKTCYRCAVNVEVATVVKEGVELRCLKCPKCGEEYFTSSELVRFDILTGRRKMVRKFGVLGDSMIMRFPQQVLEHYNIKPGDYAVFEEKKEGILLKPVHAQEL